MNENFDFFFPHFTQLTNLRMKKTKSLILSPFEGATPSELVERNDENDEEKGVEEVRETKGEPNRRWRKAVLE